MTESGSGVSPLAAAAAYGSHPNLIQIETLLKSLD
jgi:hypothetical protein